MSYEKIKITDIIPGEYNPREISNKELEKLKNSINEFGFVDPIIINLKNNHIIGGHQRYNVLVEKYVLDKDLEELNIIKLGDIGWVFPNEEREVKSEDYEKALNIALNKIRGEWEYEKLNVVLQDLAEHDFEVGLTGFEAFVYEKSADDEPVEEFFNDLDEEFENGDEYDYDYVEEGYDEVDEEPDENMFDFLDADEEPDENMLVGKEIQRTVLPIFKFGKHKIEMTEDEFVAIKSLHEQYVSRQNSEVGFMAYLLGDEYHE